MRLQEALLDFISRVGVIITLVLVSALIILGVLVLINPDLVAWLVGIGLVLGGIALLAALIMFLTGRS